MQRIKIEAPGSYPFSTEIPVRITDLNYGGHVGNDAFLSLVHEARVRYLQSLGYSELNVEGFGLIMADAAIRFSKELFYGDVVTIEVAATGFTTVSFDLIYQLKVKRDDVLVTAGLAKTGMVLIDRTNRKKASLPERVIQLLQGGH